MSEAIHFTLNGRPTVLEVDGSRMLLWVLRTELGLTGTKFGCGEGFCGSCTVLVNGKAERSCTLAVEEVAGKEVVTIEGLASNGALHPVQAAFVEHDALQCGFCTPGMILSAYSLLLANPNSVPGPTIRSTRARGRPRCRTLNPRSVGDFSPAGSEALRGEGAAGVGLEHFSGPSVPGPTILGGCMTLVF